MSAQVYSVPDQTEGRRKVSLEWESIDLSHELSLTFGIMLTSISFHQPIATSKNREHPVNFKKKSVKFSFQLSSAILLSKMKLLFFSL